MRFLFSIFFLASFTIIAQDFSLSGRFLNSVGVGIEGVTIRYKKIGAVSNSSGYFDIKIPRNKQITLVVSHISFRPDTISVNTVGKQKNIIKYLVENQTTIPEITLIEDDDRKNTIVKINPKELSVLTSTVDGVESLIKTLPGVTSTNEMSSQYSVRGGNFDENLVYVNDVEIYRPFLIRSGEQEGLSFINPDMVAAIEFSAGGFEARYGDKLSSVLDITYKQPRKKSITLRGSMLGGGITIENYSKNKRFSSLIGIRYRSNSYLLGSLDTDADFTPDFTDMQTYITYHFSPEIKISLLGNYARNRYNIIPQTRETEFGTINEALKLTVYFDGQEQDSYETGMGALITSFQVNSKLNLKWISSVFHTEEQEFYDINGEYWLGELDNNLGSDNFGDVVFDRGIGAFLDHSRNQLRATVHNYSHKASWLENDKSFQWGVKYQKEFIKDKLKEWSMIDSAFYSLPYQDSLQILLNESITSDTTLNSYRFSSYFQHSNSFERNQQFGYNSGIRFNYWSFNKELLITPRASIWYKPNWQKDMLFRLSTGLYHQSPFYRELRDLDGNINIDVKAQKSVHVVFGNDFQFTWWDRPFKLVSEIYYKYLYDIVPYELDNVRIRYYAHNNAKGYATGIDLRLNGEFVPGVESWASLSVMSIKEDILDDFYLDENENIIYPGYIAKPTDQRVNFSIFFQDYLPNLPTYTVNLSLVYGSGMPFGAPKSERYQQNFRIPPYKRVDIGFSKVFIDKNNLKVTSKFKKFDYLSLSLEVFNLLQIRNTVSYIWVMDVYGTQYAVPNYLTSRLVNLKLVAKL